MNFIKTTIDFFNALSFFLIFFCLNVYKVHAQCPTGNINLNSQQQVDDFALTYPGCTELLGNLTIDDAPATPIYNLNGLGTCTK